MENLESLSGQFWKAKNCNQTVASICPQFGNVFEDGNLENTHHLGAARSLPSEADQSIYSTTLSAVEFIMSWMHRKT